MLSHPFTSVTRWLLVVVGCALLARAQPMSAADEPSPTPARSAETIIYPKNSGVAPAGDSTRVEGYSPNWMPLFVLLLAAAGGWIWWQRRQGSPLLDSAHRKLRVEETRALGNRQYLVVANYDGKRFLIGVTPGQIQLLSPLPEGDPATTSSASTKQ